MPYTFKWKETIQQELIIPDDKILGVTVRYEMTDSEGEIKEKDGRVVICWPDAPDTFLDTKNGVEILKNCQPF